ncbi:oligouridylate-binding protein 1-like [Cynara cardunculus var. scolymus]|uniref:oligouridylate-binding protein 1-like n=1 Tax=Cynara cardunculus var. scolymus TaxID=59895 RepID=UPI000D62322E|nr:oligouridylate-binding protein 1-like [Cynara cardunculus var. scolymus]
MQQQQQQQQRIRQQQALMQQSLYHPGLLASPQIEPILSGNLPPGFDSTTCRSVYVGNIHPQVTEILLQEIFSSTGALEGCKLIRKEKSSYGFVDYFDRRCAALAIVTLNGRHVFGQPIKVNWAYASSQREDTSGHFNIFVGDLSPEVTDATLFSCFSVYSTCSDARVMWDQKTGRSRGFGFVSFRSQQEAQSAINDMNGKWLGSRQIRCNWAAKGAGTDDKQSSDSKSVVELTNGTSDDGQEKTSEDAPGNNPQYTTVYVGNLAPEVTSVDLHRHFHALGAGVIEDVRIQRDKGFGFIRYSSHAEAARAIQFGNARVLFGKPLKCSWGSKPTPPGTSSSPLPPPVATNAHANANVGGFSAAELAAYERQVALSKMGGVQALMHQQAQRMGMGMGMGMGASQAVYDGGYSGIAGAQPPLYYQ